jgi:hypothetical protein
VPEGIAIETVVRAGETVFDRIVAIEGEEVVNIGALSIAVFETS